MEERRGKSGGVLSRLAEQVLEAKVRGAELEAGGQDARLAQAVGRSLRRTLGVLLQFGDPGPLALSGFSLSADREGGIRVQHRGRLLPVSESYVRALFGEAGVGLEPGQVVLLDLALAGALLEQALEACGQEEARLRDLGSRLQEARAEALDPGLGRRVPAVLAGPTGAASVRRGPASGKE